MSRESDAATYRSVLAIPDFRRLVAGFMASQLGDWLYNVALLVYVADKTHSASWVAAATMVRLIPLAVVGPFAGVIADRYERVGVMIRSAARAIVRQSYVAARAGRRRGCRVFRSAA